MNLELHKHLRLSVLIIFIVAVVVLAGSNVWIQGGLFRGGRVQAGWPIYLLLAGTCGFCLLLLFSQATQSWALRDTGEMSAIRRELWFIVIVGAGVGAIALYRVLSTPSA